MKDNITRDAQVGQQTSRPATPGTRLDELWRLLPEESAANASGVLTIGGVAVDELAAEYGTPLHIYDEAGLRRQARRFVTGLARRWPNSQSAVRLEITPAVAMYRLAVEEGLAIDVAGGGELRLALAADVDPAMVYFHGNAKTDAELTHALDAGVGTIIVDNEDELDRLERILRRPQAVMLRVIPGIDARTHHPRPPGQYVQIRAAVRPGGPGHRAHPSEPALSVRGCASTSALKSSIPSHSPTL